MISFFRISAAILLILFLFTVTLLVSTVGQRDKAWVEIGNLNIKVASLEQSLQAEREAAERNERLLVDAKELDRKLANISKQIAGVKINAEKEPCFYAVPDASTIGAFEQLDWLRYKDGNSPP